MEKKMKIRKQLKYIGIWCMGVVLFAPVLLAFTEGENGQPTIWNFVGIIWMLGLAYLAKRYRGTVKKFLKILDK